MCNSFYFTGKRQRAITKMERKHVTENLILSFVIIAREHAGTQNMQGMLAHEHVIMWARRHARHVGTWERKYTRHVGTWARKHARHVDTWTRKARNLEDPNFFRYLLCNWLCRCLIEINGEKDKKWENK